jgi:hypothetical protein
LLLTNTLTSNQNIYLARLLENTNFSAARNFSLQIAFYLALFRLHTRGVWEVLVKKGKALGLAEITAALMVRWLRFRGQETPNKTGRPCHGSGG